jgi:hypothetical protein
MVDHWEAEARGLGDPDAARDHGPEHQVGEVVSELALDIVREPGALVVHRDHHPGQNQRRVEPLANPLQGLEELHQALEREVFSLNRDDHPVGGDQGVEGHRAQRWWAIEQGEGETLANRAEHPAKVALGALDPGELDRGAGQVRARWHDPQVVGAGRPGRLGDGLASRSSPSATVALHWESRSQISTWLPEAAAQAAMLTAVVVFPTPPFWLAIA